MTAGNEIPNGFSPMEPESTGNCGDRSDTVKRVLAVGLDRETPDGKSRLSSRAKDRNKPGNDHTPATLDWLVLQIADSAFPAGGFAHSNGLEAAWQQGEIRSPEELIEFVEAHLAQTGTAALPFVNECYDNRRSFAQIDGLCDVFLSNHVANRSSRAQGQAFLFAAAHAFEPVGLRNLRAEVAKEKLPGHLAPVFGTILRTLQVSHLLCSRLFLFMNVRTLVASAVRLGIVGPLAAQSLQWRIGPYAEKIAFHCSDLRLADVAQTSPLLDILQGAHDRLYSRLFQT